MVLLTIDYTLEYGCNLSPYDMLYELCLPKSPLHRPVFGEEWDDSIFYTYSSSLCLHHGCFRVIVFLSSLGNKPTSGD